MIRQHLEEGKEILLHLEEGKVTHQHLEEDKEIPLHLEEDKVILLHLGDMAIHLLHLADKEFLSSGNEVEHLAGSSLLILAVVQKKTLDHFEKAQRSYLATAKKSSSSLT